MCVPTPLLLRVINLLHPSCSNPVTPFLGPLDKGLVQVSDDRVTQIIFDHSNSGRQLITDYEENDNVGLKKMLPSHRRIQRGGWA